MEKGQKEKKEGKYFHVKMVVDKTKGENRWHCGMLQQSLFEYNLPLKKTEIMFKKKKNYKSDYYERF